MTSTLETTNLVKLYFNICNTALASQKYSAVYGTLLAVLNEVASGDIITLKVVGKEGDEDRYYTTRFIDGEFTPIMDGARDADAQFTVDHAYLESIVKDADRYIANPEKLDWSWLRSRK